MVLDEVEEGEVEVTGDSEHRLMEFQKSAELKRGRRERRTAAHLDAELDEPAATGKDSISTTSSKATHQSCSGRSARERTSRACARRSVSR